MVNSRAKGKRIELEAAEQALLWFGTHFRRTSQVRGKNDGAPDIEATGPNKDRFKAIHIEVKGRGRIAAARFLAQAQREAGSKIPLVLMRQTSGPAEERRWMALTFLCDLRHLGRNLHEAAEASTRLIEEARQT